MRIYTVRRGDKLEYYITDKELNFIGAEVISIAITPKPIRIKGEWLNVPSDWGQ